MLPAKTRVGIGLAPILLDLERHEASTRKWFDRWDLAVQWTGKDKDDDQESRWADHVGGSEAARRRRG